MSLKINVRGHQKINGIRREKILLLQTITVGLYGVRTDLSSLLLVKYCMLYTKNLSSKTI